MSSAQKIIQAAAGNAGEPVVAADVFSVDLYTGNSSTQTITNGIDLSGEGGLVWISTRNNAGGGEKVLVDTERGATRRLRSYSTDSEAIDSTGLTSFNSDGFTLGDDSGYNYSTGTYVAWTFRKAPEFFDVVTYTSPGGSPDPQIYNHNLKVEPELIIIKSRDNTYNWVVYEKNLGTSNMALDGNFAAGILNSRIESATATTFTVGTQGQAGGFTNGQYVAYLFATLPEVSKVGSYTGNGTNQIIDCGFTTGARFFMTKRTDSTSNWNIFDSERGIAAGNDPRLEANTSDAEDTNGNYTFNDNSGFYAVHVANDDNDNNINGANYIFIAIQ